MKKSLLFACLGLLISAVVSVGAIAPVMAANDKIKVVTPRNSVFVLMYYGGRDAGIYRKHGIDLEMFGTDGSVFGCNWSTKAINEAEISDEARQKILHHTAANMLSHLAPLAQFGQAAE